jgi:hypothetical protein
MSSIRGLGSLLLWLSGALAALTAILYAIGYLATAANLHLLGLDRAVLGHDNLLYLERGGLFVLHTAEILAHQGFVLALLLVLGLGAWLLLRRAGPRLRRLARLGRAGEERRLWLLGLARGAAYTLLLALVVLLVAFHRPLALPYLGLTDLLFDDLPAAMPAPAVAEADFRRVLLAGALVPALALAAWWVCAGLAHRGLLMIPFLIAAVSFLPLVVVLHGKLVVDNHVREVLALRGGELLPADGCMYLLGRGEDDLLLWLPNEGSVLWLPAGTVLEARFGRSVSLHEITERPVPADGEVEACP